MHEQDKSGIELSEQMHNEITRYRESLTLDYCGFRLKSLAKRIKSECMKLKKQERRFLNP